MAKTWKEINAGRADYLKAYFAEHYKKTRQESIERSRAWYAENREEALERQRAYRLANPLTPEQKERRRLKAAERRKANPEKSKDSRHRERARRRECGAMPSRAKMAELLKDAKCAACGSVDNPEIDHILPLRLGGTHSAENLQILCRPCNRSKGSKHPDDWKGRRNA